MDGGLLSWLDEAVKITVIIPVFNEEGSIEEVLDAVLALDLSPHVLEIIASDDGSTDRTSRLLAPYAERHPRVRIVGSRVNRGKGAAIRSGLEVATGDLIVIQDADTEYSPADLPALLGPLLDGSAEVVYGSRFLERRWPIGMRARNLAANRLFTGLANLLYGGSITDEGTGYKLFRRDLLESLRLEARRFEFCAEVTAKLLRRRIRIVEIPVSYEGRGRSGGGNPGVADGLHILWTLLRFRFTEPAPGAASLSGE